MFMSQLGARPSATPRMCSAPEATMAPKIMPPGAPSGFGLSDSCSTPSLNSSVWLDCAA